MNISLNWIREFVDLPALPAAEIGWKVTVHTAEVEAVVDEAKNYENMVVGEVMEVKKHPGADRLNLAQVDIGDKQVQVVCGGQNLYSGMKVAVALPGAWVKWHGEGEPVQLSETKIRGEASTGMICAGEEIGLSPDNTAESKEVRIHDLSYADAKAGTPLAKALHREDVLLEVDNKSLTHRPDLWSHYGFARELGAIFGKPVKKLDSFLKIKVGEAREKVSVKIEDEKMCPRFSACIMTGIKIEESPQWVKARLQSAGMNPHNTIVDITNYVMLELGQPMHAYDRTVVGDDGFVVRYAKKGEKLVTLDETEQKLSEEDPLVCNAANEPMGIAGIKGGLKSGISENTTEIILESANFDPVVVRKSSMRHQLRTDASQRFEKGLDAGMTEMALKRAIHLIQKLCPHAKVVSEITTAGSWKPKESVILVSPENICKKIGVDISVTEITRILKSLEFGVVKSGKNLKITVPPHRATGDVDIEEDIVEEVARIYGYDRIPAVRPHQPMQLPLPNEERFYKHRLRDLFALGLGFTEVVNYSFYSKDRLEKCGMTEEGHLKILNYLSEDQTHMRMSLVPNLLAAVAMNNRSFPLMRVFEVGRTYKEIGAFMPLEEKRIAAVVTSEDEPFYLAKGALETFFKKMNVGAYELKPSAAAPSYAHPKKCVDLAFHGKTIGQLFTLHPAVLKAFDIGMNTAAFELCFSDLVKSGQKTSRFHPLPKFPGMAFDVSILVDKRNQVGELERVIRSADTEGLMQTVELFDVYEGQGIPEDKKSLSFSVEIRHDDRTLTDQELKAVQDRVFLALEKFGGKIRGQI